MDTRNTGNISVLMLPWLAHGHISPYLNLAKQLSTRNFNIYLCSTPINLNSIKNNITDKWSNSIHLVELLLAPTPDLPAHYHSTNGLPPHLMASLETAFENSSANFLKIFESVKPDLLIYDYNQPWAADIASSNNVPAVQFVISSAMFSSLSCHMLSLDLSVSYPFPISIHKYFTEKMMKARVVASPDDAKNIERVKGATKRSKAILLRSFREIEGKYIDYFSVLSGKKMIPVGPLVQEAVQDTDDDCTEAIEFLNKKDESSVVFVSFGSEYFLSKEEIQEIAYGLELSKMSFIWVVRFPFGENMKLQEAIPLGFLDRVGDRGLVIEGWAPQVKILRHSSTGGFISHCGWSSIMESMMFGVPIIGMPMHIDQPFNAVVVKEVGVGQEVERDENGKFKREEIAKVIRNVVIQKNGETVRSKAKEISEMIREKGEKEIDQVAEKLIKLCKEKKDEIKSFKML